MVIKSLTITEDAYDALNRLKHSHESFSKTILRISREKAHPVEKYFGILKRSESEVKNWEKSIKERRREINKDMKQRQQNLRRIMLSQ